MTMKALSIRLDNTLSREFGRVCREAGYKKNTLLTRLIAAYIQHQKRTKERAKGSDPFARVVGAMNIAPLLSSPDDIDRTVYNL